jgi:hypothetical protein
MLLLERYFYITQKPPGIVGLLGSSSRGLSFSVCCHAASLVLACSAIFRWTRRGVLSECVSS